MIKAFLRSLFLLPAMVAAALPARAEDSAPHSDVATPLQLGLHHPATPQMERLVGFHDGLVWMCVLITLFVLGLLLWVVVRYNAKANPVPSKTTHNVPLEIIWTILPVVILIVIAVPSFKHLFYLGKTPETEMTLKVTGYQWYWGYEYPDHGGLAFESRMIPEKEIDESKGQKRLLSTDNVVYLPIDTNIQIIVTAADVIHSLTVPAFGIKKDAVPGRLNETWVRIDKPGTYYGQCSEICGTNHAYMPIEVRAVPKEEFAAWVEKAKKEFADNGYQPLQLANIEDMQ